MSFERRIASTALILMALLEGIHADIKTVKRAMIQAIITDGAETVSRMGRSLAVKICSFCRRR